MGEIKINFGKWEDAIEDIDRHILNLYDERSNFLGDIQSSISGLPGDHGYKWPAHSDVGSSKTDVDNKRADLESFKNTLSTAYDNVKGAEDNLAERLYTDSNDFMHANGIKPEYEKGLFEKFCEGVVDYYKNQFEVIKDIAVWLWDSGTIQLIGEILIAVAAVVTFIACFPVSGFMGVLTAIGLGWGAAKAIVDVVADTASVVKYAQGDEEGAEEWSNYNMRSLFDAAGEGLNDLTGLECFDEIGDILYIGLDTVEFITGATEFGSNWKANLYGRTNLNTYGTDVNKVFDATGDVFIHENNKAMKFLTGGKEYTDYDTFKKIKKVGKTIAEFPDKGFASFTNLVSDKNVAQWFKNTDKAIDFVKTPLSITLDGLEENGVITGSDNKTISNVYKNIKTGKDVVKNIYTNATATGTIFGGSNMNFSFLRETSLGYAPTLGTPMMISSWGSLSGWNGGETSTLMGQIVDSVR